MIPALFGQDTRDEILAEIKNFAPDAAVVDCMIGAGLEVTDMLDLPRAVLIHILYSMFTDKWGSRATRKVNATYLDHAGQVLVLVPPGFDTTSRLPPNTSNVGPITDPNPGPSLSARMTELLAEPGNPWVLLSLGTTLQDQATALPRILEAVARLPIRVLLTLGDVLPPGAIDAPPNVTVCGFIPHRLLMPHIAAVVSHGGLSPSPGPLRQVCRWFASRKAAISRTTRNALWTRVSGGLSARMRDRLRLPQRYRKCWRSRLCWTKQVTLLMPLPR